MMPPYREIVGQNTAVIAPQSARLWASARRDLMTLVGYVENADARLAPGALLGITRGPTADFNLALLDTAAGGDEVLGEFVDQVTKAGVSAVFMVSSACAERLGPMARKKGLEEVGTAPLMVLTVADAIPQKSGYEVQRVVDEKGLADVADLTSAAFALDRGWVGRTFCSAALLPARAITFFLASKDGEPYSAVTTTAGGAEVGIWSMATSPNRLRQGAGRAVLLAAIDHHRGLGATTFYLIATPSGKPLYDSLGFKTVEEFPMWVKS
jgi:GNAT superfamily N-acetyltransferase